MYAVCVDRHVAVLAPNVAWKRIQVDDNAPPANFRSVEGGRNRQDDRSGAVGPHKSKDHDADARQSRVSQSDALTHRKVDKQINKNAGYSHGDRPLWRSQMFITSVTSSQVNVRGM